MDSITIIQCAGNVLRLGGASGNHFSVPAEKTINLEDQNQETNTDKFYYIDGDKTCYLQCQFESHIGGQEEGVFSALDVKNNQEQWNRILAERCNSMYNVIVNKC